MKKLLSSILLLSVLFLLPSFDFLNASETSSRLKGKILLQVESNGEAWYVNPDNEKRYFLGRPDDAFRVMRELGLGISSKDFDSFKGIVPKRLSGKILIKVEDNGKAYYANPGDLKMHFLGRPADAFQIMRKLGLGISNNDLNKIVAINEIKDLSNAEIIAKLKESVVYIETNNSVGSGFIIESTGYILTNAHVVKDVLKTNIILSDNSTHTATIVGRDEIMDIALLKIEKSSLKNVSLGNSDKVKSGDNIYTLGYPFGIKGDVSFKDGTISRLVSSAGSTYFEISAEIHPGNSGGPLVDRYGNVVGINTAAFGQSIQGVSVGETIKLAIPINIAKNILTDLKNGRNVLEVNSPSSINDDANSEKLIKKQEMTAFLQKWNTCVAEYNTARTSEEEGFFNDKAPSAKIINYNDAIAHYQSSYDCFQTTLAPITPFTSDINSLKNDYLQLTNISKQLAQIMLLISEYERDNKLEEALELFPELTNLNDKREPFTQSVKTKETSFIKKVTEYNTQLD